MATAAQIAANKLNSQKSTGPQTPEGKARSSKNRLSHGFESTEAIMPGENQDQFDALLADLQNEYQPATPTEEILVETMAQSHWFTLRAVRLQNRNLGISLAIDKFGLPTTLGLLIRYHSTAERAFHRAHNELVKAQKERKKCEIGFESQNAAQPQEPAPPQPEESPDPLPQMPPEFKIDPDFTYFTPAEAAKAAKFARAA
jgi:hypothetical protein